MQNNKSQLDKIIIAGGTGFIGQALVKHWFNKYKIIIIGRNTAKIHKIYNSKVTAYSWDDWVTCGCDIANGALGIINLAGTNIGDKYWTKKVKLEIIESRVSTTKAVANICFKMGLKSPKLLNASAAGVYGAHADGSTIFDETNQITNIDYLSKIGVAWEQSTQEAESSGVKVIKLRFGVVLDLSGGVLKKMKLPFLLGLGGNLGLGSQPFAWVSLVDVVSIIDWLLLQDITGPINIVAPEVVSQAEFALKFATFLHRKCFFSMPAWLIRLVLGEMGEILLLNGQAVSPKKLIDAGYKFKCSSLDVFFDNCLKTKI